MKKRYLFISCKEAQHICDKAQYNEATGWEKLKLMLRYGFCRVTRTYVQKNIKLSDSVKSSKIDCLNAMERAQIKTKFNKELSKQER
ncbi:hypothetical protein BZARG_909 [Bizionia argentinensis JUB59]|uniref:Glycine dehydrogenase n=1 Tax=Bizionia argentinensis JUB59 TaxID=1046627 RepID=G2EBM9_9FLAO|nr:hypothetical protein [Bizionia argentinensis]EGV44223.1 hypothetical protein BZARG_909 [Bizionia argentinensis JUB59]